MKYFAYGSNLLERRLKEAERTPSAAYRENAILPSYQLRFHKRGQDGSGKANCFYTGNPDDQVVGIIYELSDKEIPALDRVEDVLGGGYARREMSVITKTASTAVESYFCTQGFIDEHLPPFDWYKALVVAGAMEHNLPSAYIQTLCQLEHISDPDEQKQQAALAVLGVYATPYLNGQLFNDLLN